MIRIIVPDTQKSTLEGICGQEATVISLKDDYIKIKVNGKTIKGDINDLVSPDDIEKVKSIFRRGKVAWATRQLKKVF
jgi:hypothetical protein